MNTKSYLSILAFVIVLLSGGAFVYSKQNSQTSVVTASAANTTETTPSHPLAVAATEPSKTSQYKDGTYSAVGSYQVPEGKSESINVSVTLQNGNIVDASVTAAPRDHDSKRFINQFISGYKSFVIGKSIDSVRLDNVSGSSLTSNGWNTAIESIKSQAAV